MSSFNSTKPINELPPLLPPLQQLLTDAEELANLAYRQTANEFKQVSNTLKDVGRYITPELTLTLYSQLNRAQENANANLAESTNRLLAATQEVMQSIEDSNIPDTTEGRHLAKQIIKLMLNPDLYDEPNALRPSPNHARHLNHQPYFTALKGKLPVVAIDIQPTQHHHTYDISVRPYHHDHDYHRTVTLQPREAMALENQLNRFLINVNRISPTLLRNI